MRISVNDLAVHLGLSPSTVSKALNDYPDVSAGTRQRVLQAAHDLRYHPSSAARSLRSKRTGRLGFYVYSEAPGHWFASDFYPGVMRGAATTAEMADYNVVLYTRWSDSLDRLLRICRSREVDGLILLRGEFNRPDMDEPVNLLRENGLPFVVMHQPVAAPDVSFIVPDDQMGGYLATEHLLRQGHRRVAYIGRLPAEPPDVERLAGYRKALAEYGVPYDDKLVLHGYRETEDERLRREARAFLDRPDRPTAVFAFNDVRAAGVMRACADIGLRVPQDLAIVGYDDLPFAHLLTPGLTTVHQALAEMGKLACDALLKCLHDPSCPPVRELVPVELVVRASSVASQRAPVAGSVVGAELVR